MNKSKIKLNCIDMKDLVQQKIYDDIKNLSAKEEIKYFKNSVKKSRFSHLLKKNTNK